MHSAKQPDLIQDAYVQATVKLAHTRCIEPERLSAAVQGELSPEETRRIIDHCSLCPLCAEEWRACKAMFELLVVESQPEVNDSPSSEPVDGKAPLLNRLRLVAANDAIPTDREIQGGCTRRATRSRNYWMGGLAVAACLAVIWLQKDPGQETEARRVMRGEATTVSKLHYASQEGVFSWEKKSEAGAPCRVSIWDETLNPVATLESNARSARAPEETLKALRLMPKFIWQVECYETKRGWSMSKTVVQRNEVR